MFLAGNAYAGSPTSSAAAISASTAISASAATSAKHIYTCPSSVNIGQPTISGTYVVSYFLMGAPPSGWTPRLDNVAHGTYQASHPAMATVPVPPFSTYTLPFSNASGYNSGGHGYIFCEYNSSSTLPGGWVPSFPLQLVSTVSPATNIWVCTFSGGTVTCP